MRDKSIIIGKSEAHLQLLQTLDRIAPIDAEVLITGPTGVGKELYANYIHRRGGRAGNAAVALHRRPAFGLTLER
jgi:DNA-binding NtrC family response regulator